MAFVLCVARPIVIDKQRHLTMQAIGVGIDGVLASGGPEAAHGARGLSWGIGVVGIWAVAGWARDR